MIFCIIHYYNEIDIQSKDIRKHINKNKRKKLPDKITYQYINDLILYIHNFVDNKN